MGSPVPFDIDNHNETNRDPLPSLIERMLCERSRFVLQGLKCRRSFATVSKAAEKVFSDTNSAAFLAAAGDLNSVPGLHGLPEVSSIHVLMKILLLTDAGGYSDR